MAMETDSGLGSKAIKQQFRTSVEQHGAVMVITALSHHHFCREIREEQVWNKLIIAQHGNGDISGVHLQPMLKLSFLQILRPWQLYSTFVVCTGLEM